MCSCFEGLQANIGIDASRFFSFENYARPSQLLKLQRKRHKMWKIPTKCNVQTFRCFIILWYKACSAVKRSEINWLSQTPCSYRQELTARCGKRHLFADRGFAEIINIFVIGNDTADRLKNVPKHGPRRRQRTSQTATSVTWPLASKWYNLRSPRISTSDVLLMSRKKLARIRDTTQVHALTSWPLGQPRTLPLDGKGKLYQW